MKKLVLAVLALFLISACSAPNDQALVDETKSVTVYFVADTPRGFKLFSENREITAPSSAFASTVISQLISGSLQPIDPDYVNLWDSSNSLNEVVISGAQATVDLNLGKLNVGAESEIRAIEQIVWTLTGITPSLTTVRFLVNGEQVETIAGHVDTSVDFKRVPDYEVLSPLQIDSLSDGAELSLPISVAGYACTFEANVIWTITQNDKFVVDGVTTAAAACPERSKWQVTLPDLEPGEYLFTVKEFSAEDGSLFALDSKRLVVK